MRADIEILCAEGEFGEGGVGETGLVGAILVGGECSARRKTGVHPGRPVPDLEHARIFDIGDEACARADLIPHAVAIMG
ncbi:MAG: hypothetical protein JNK94_06210 [Hyphomonadaceae bacterium]|nr:hypothetical protein [Hyphomonadaceae bacterium]